MFNDSKKPVSNIPTTQSNAFDDLGLDDDDRWNQTAGSNFSYTPTFGGTGTLTNALPGKSNFDHIVLPRYLIELISSARSYMNTF